MCALSVAIMYAGSLFDLLDMTMAALASFLTVVVVIELGGIYPLGLYFSSSVLSFLLLPQKSVSLIYILFFGFYPIIKRYFERTKMLISWILKFGTFNILLVVYYFIVKLFFPNDIELLKIPVAILLNVIFVCFDLALSLFVAAYVRRFRKLFGVDRFFK